MLERNRKAIEEGREPRHVPSLPPGWDGWGDALEDAIMAERYGWTQDEIDAADRQRVRFWWAVQDVHREASRYLHKVQGGTANALESRERWAR